MKKYLLFALLAGLTSITNAQKQNTAYLNYIAKWKNVAVQQQKEHGIPASITMAQALLESAAGQSELAVNANNHFGIKCTSSWTGAVYHHDDETAGECFRKYKNASESYEDHSLFLLRPRYAVCFEIAVEDYEGWANQLRACGYATDKLYPQKLIKLIEDYRLDTIGADQPAGTYNPQAANTKSSASQQSAGTAQNTANSGKRPLKATVVRGSDPIMVIHNSPAEQEYVEPMTARQERDSFFASHPKKRYNGVVYVMSREGDTYANVAFRLNVRERDLREDNDALGRNLTAGERIFLSPKKTMGVQDKPYIWTRPGESFWKICQDEAVQMDAIRKLNDLDKQIRVFRTRQKLYLRKVKEEDDGIN